MTRSAGSRGVVVLGSTGSVGRSTLDVIAALPERLHVVGLAAARNRAALQAQIDATRPRVASLGTGEDLRDVRAVSGPDALTALATLEDAEIVVVATTGHAAIVPTIRALQAGKIVALANKETIVSAGAIVMPIARARPGALRPVDSEHSALWQCLGADVADPARVRRLVLTASGGPFRDWTAEQLQGARPADALKHPTWDMGAKITVDSATLMNKGLELIEASWLFDCALSALDIVVHPQSIVHSLVEFVDGSFLAQLGSHDMRLPIQLALTWPERVAGPATPLSLTDVARLEFAPLDDRRFPLPGLARAAAERGATYPTVLSTADELAVEAFLTGRLPFVDIATLVSTALDAHTPAAGPMTLDAIAEADAWTKTFVTAAIAQRGAR